MNKIPTAYQMVCRKLDKAEKEIERLRENIKIATMQLARHRFDEALKTLQQALKEK